GPRQPRRLPLCSPSVVDVGQHGRNPPPPAGGRLPATPVGRDGIDDSQACRSIAYPHRVTARHAPRIQSGVTTMKKSSLYLISSREDIAAAMEHGLTFSTLAKDAAAAFNRGSTSWAEICRFGSEDAERLETVAAIIAATES